MSGNQYDAYDATPVSVPDLPAEVDQDLSSEQVAYYRQVLAVHSTKPDTYVFSLRWRPGRVEATDR